ncbi:hypothetical protein A2774_01005 [Candidatus Roizmanbacteria bacterium RIFCSPHIGHO2_01_FULL_39_12c]|uniref:Uncharacterized protein n=1 Tax=Candidatus Roizmanbacteria bacterium RIFCSPHIGHO2_01_FULL_39_12c TaxID=1802031 RepID=A0A1F7G7R5_9BACT|nr:MAG: hypothetical protein A2774_01005 [Candidatus Roizmanbacteria bacterium RIFCSPHIGHO2_01_FULL_39_12c]OGK46410.1 MAG: hypothetical protein A2963_01415 [Candidatus Roizmanbacteria bacterium RIFCSPLOWO2_01_FULL_40_13]
MDYYEQKQFLGEVDKQDKIIGQIEKWEAHKNGILHRGYTCILTYQYKVLLQHRKHPVFDGVFDLSFSSHPILLNQQKTKNILSFSRHAYRQAGKRESGRKNGSLIPTSPIGYDGRGRSGMTKNEQHEKIGLQSMDEAIYAGLKREWNIEQKQIKAKPKFLKKIYYKAKDPQSNFTEHEIDYIYSVELRKPPTPNYDFAYGFSIVNRKQITDYRLPLSPWVKVIINEKLI